MILLALGCGASSIEIEVVGEDGSLLTQAVAVRPDGAIEADSRGRIGLRLDRPELWMVEAPGHLAEPVIVGPDDHRDRVEVRLLQSDGRHVLHFGGDVMFARRYEQPSSGRALIDPDDRDACARAVVSDLAPFFSAAELSMVNLESVVGELPDDGAYPAKRWLLQTHPESLAAIDELGVDVVALANNHQRDWLDEGVSSTAAALDARGIPWLGVGTDAAEATQTLVVDLDGMRVGVVAFTSVDGDFVNEFLPTSQDPRPAELDDEDAWKWEERTWGAEDVPEELRVAGDAWLAFIAVEEELEDVAEVWASVVAVYPELQDWVARRGHGGAAHWDPETAVDLVEGLADDTDLIVVQLHMGYQFSDAPSAGVRDAARDVLDAGADIVIGHHPHVLQGIEIDDGRLIAWSLGNLAFDQDFLSTWQSVVLRAIYSDSGELLDARVVPVLLDDYRPVPVAGEPARDLLREVLAAGLNPTTSSRGEDGRVRATPTSSTGEGIGLAFEHGTGRIVEPRATASSSLRVPRKGSVALPGDGLVGVTGSGVLVGRDLWSLGSFEDDEGDARDDLAGWSLSPSTSIVHSGDQARHVLEMRRESLNQSSVVATFDARVTMLEHRIWSGPDGEGLDGDATFSVRFIARGEGDRNEGLVNVTLQHFDDTNPTEDPWTLTLHEVSLPFSIGGFGWQEVVVDIPPELLLPVDGLAANSALVQFELPPPPFRTSLLQIDDVEFVEWRAARGDLGPYTRVRSADGSSHTANVEMMPW